MKYKFTVEIHDEEEKFNFFNIFSLTKVNDMTVTFEIKDVDLEETKAVLLSDPTVVWWNYKEID